MNCQNAINFAKEQYKTAITFAILEKRLDDAQTLLDELKDVEHAHGFLFSDDVKNDLNEALTIAQLAQL